MKKISQLAPFVFFIFVVLSGLQYFLPGTLLNLRKMELLKYNPDQATEYSEDQAKQIISGKDLLEQHDLEDLLRFRTLPYEVPPESANSIEVSKERIDCREVVSLLKDERDERIAADSNKLRKSSVVSILTVIMGILLWVLKRYKWKSCMEKETDLRESLISLCEFGYGVFVLAINLFL